MSGLFKGFKPVDLYERNERFLIAVLSEELARTVQAFEAMSEEMEHLKKQVGSGGNDPEIRR